ncbi:class I SAM-dependent methyltransferase [Mucilaginibacter pallidiroseus]|uniref:Class I SAM-dependent methyltransferase n=1 Tax=Mucilaginibacter pallidiroseus TaxID=2599295 RepID=A0A563TX75_9SPHI|nr:class I SAM-dependent methyltransferase [Mucilaginibacter pallidiroseus]TWR23843.1 class I SAM-dependent methyltransferase [Mucilaginibacter pallidiroseus]
MSANYDNSAAFYDRLSKLVFGNALINAQKYFLPQIPANSRVLIIGGGTGWILEEVTKVHSSGLHIIYVELSAKMTALSRKRSVGNNAVKFINRAIEDVYLEQPVDVIITPFLMDNYKDDALPATFKHIDKLLKPNGIWLNTDFRLTGKWWQFLLLKSMLIFFKILCGVQNWRLPNVDKQFSLLGYARKDQKSFYGDFVMTRLYKKPK